MRLPPYDPKSINIEDQRTPLKIFKDYKPEMKIFSNPGSERKPVQRKQRTPGVGDKKGN